MFGDAVAMHVSGELNIPVLVLDTEMSKKDHHNRMLACLSGVEINKITTGRFAESEIEKEKVLGSY
jgi:replicative DNA helicase